jgi:hypothetical protein
MRRLLMTSCVIAALCALVQAQGQQPPPTRPPQTAPPARPAQTPPGGDVPVPPAPGAQQPQRPPTPGASGAVTPQPGPQQNNWQNIKLDLVITDVASASPQLRKVLSLYIADGRQGQVRSQSDGLINVDARPQVRPDGKTILLQLTVEYRPDARGSLFSESLTAMVIDGKPLMLSQTVDPSGDRKVSVEVTATIQKN